MGSHIDETLDSMFVATMGHISMTAQHPLRLARSYREVRLVKRRSLPVCNCIGAECLDGIEVAAMREKHYMRTQQVYGSVANLLRPSAG